MADFYDQSSFGTDDFGRKGEEITPDNATDFTDVAKGVVVRDISGGSVLQLLPVDNADGDWINFTGVPVGFVPPYQVRRIGSATTCGVATVLDPRADIT